MYGPQPPQGGENLWGIAQDFTKLPCASVGSLDFQRRQSFNGDQGGAKGQLKEQFSLKAFGVVGQPLEQF
jgi:hypothetical protein